MPNNLQVAENRLGYLQRKLFQESSLKQRYTSFIDDLLDKGYARRVPDPQLERRDGKIGYL